MASSFEEFLQDLADRSLPMRVIRKSVSKMVVLGMMDAMQEPNAAMQALTGECETPAPENNSEAAAEEAKPSAVPLPRPQLIGVAEKKKPPEEPDQPGVPSKRIRNEKGPKWSDKKPKPTDSQTSGGKEGPKP